MKSKRPRIVLFAAVLSLAGAGVSQGQQAAPSSAYKFVPHKNVLGPAWPDVEKVDNSGTVNTETLHAPNFEAAESGTANEPPSPDNQTQSTDKTSSQNGTARADGTWHLVVSPYLWFPGVHGTLGARGLDTSMHASAGDLLSHFRFGLMGTADLSYKRLLLPIDMMWIRLGDDRALPFPNLGDSSADVKVSQFLLTPKLGYRVVNREALKVDALTGFRYWHVRQNLHSDPSGTEFSGSQNWADPLVGGRIQAALSPKASVTIAGDVGGWGVGSQLDYQVVGLLGYRIKPSWTLQAGYRYLDVDYRSGGVIFDVATSGVMFGVSVSLK